MESSQADLVPAERHDGVVDRGITLDLDVVPVTRTPAQNPALVYLSGLRPNSKRAREIIKCCG